MRHFSREHRRPATVIAAGVALAATLPLSVGTADAATASAAASASAGASPRHALSGLASVEVRFAGNGSWTVFWTGTDVTSVQVFVGDDARSLGKNPAAVGHGASGSVVVTTSARRPWVKVVPDRGAPVVTASRILGLASASNARDLGGYRTQDGRWVKTGVIYRTNQLTLSADDAAFVDTLGITADYDLRTASEIAAAPDVVPTGATYANLNVIGDLGSTYTNFTTPEQAAQMMRDGEVAFVDSATGKAAYRALLTSLANDKGASLYHCTAGKDRAGWASAVILTLLGVDERTVMDDYLLSNQTFLNSPAVQAQLAAMGPAAAAVYEPLMAVDPSYLQAGLDRVHEEYGSMEAYVTKGLGLTHGTVERLRERLLTPAPAHVG